MSGAVETAFHAFSTWLCENGIDPEDVNLGIRCKDDSTRWRLDNAIARWQDGLTLWDVQSRTAVRRSPFRCYGVHVNVSMLDASR